MFRRSATVVIAGVFLVAVTGCGDGSRPAVEEWRTVWIEVVGGVPMADELGDQPDQDTCRSALVTLRERSHELFPTPDLALDSVVHEWVRVAEDAFFECPPSSAEIPTMGFALRELDRLEAEVGAVLAIDGSRD